MVVLVHHVMEGGSETRTSVLEIQTRTFQVRQRVLYLSILGATNVDEFTSPALRSTNPAVCIVLADLDLILVHETLSPGETHVLMKVSRQSGCTQSSSLVTAYLSCRSLDVASAHCRISRSPTMKMQEATRIRRFVAASVSSFDYYIGSG